MKLSFAAIFFLAAYCVGGFAQQATPDLVVASRMVVLDVAVTDALGKPVLDLSKDDFRVYEDNVPQSILNLEPPSVHMAPVPLQTVVHSVDDLKKIGFAPVTVLALDELNMQVADLTFARNSLEAYLKTQPALLREPTTLLAVSYSKFSVLLDYTQDRDALLDTLHHHVAEYPWRAENAGTTGAIAGDKLFMSLGALEQIAAATRGVAGRKNILWVGDGFPSMNALSQASSTVDRVQETIRRVSRRMLEARVTLYVIGPTLKPNVLTHIESDDDAAMADVASGGRVPEGDVQFSGLALETGGRAYSGRNDMAREIAESIASGLNYYTISYVPTTKSDNPQKIRKIRVAVARPNLTATTRNGYYPSPPEDAPVVAPTKQELSFDLYGTAFSSMHYFGLDVSAKRGKTEKGDGYVVKVGASGLDWRPVPDGHRHAEVSVLAVCFSPRNRVLSHTILEMKADAASEVATQKGSYANFALPMNVPAGTIRIKFVVRDAINGHVGSVDVSH